MKLCPFSECDGSGWRSKQVNGIWGAKRCRCHPPREQSAETEKKTKRVTAPRPAYEQRELE